MAGKRKKTRRQLRTIRLPDLEGGQMVDRLPWVPGSLAAGAVLGLPRRWKYNDPDRPIMSVDLEADLQLTVQVVDDILSRMTLA